MGSLPKGDYSPANHHKNIIQQVVKDRVGLQALHRSYGRAFNGLAAWLTDHEREKLANMSEVLSIFPSRTIVLHTTRSWDFLGFPENITDNFSVGSDMIIGLIDTGIWKESESFGDEGFGPVPAKWKGACEGGPGFTCNRKIIGARFYTGTDVSDNIGHGTHTASTAAGNRVKGASYRHIAEGTARGGLPASRIAVYKACGFGGCTDADILAAYDDAIADGVDVISASVGAQYPIEHITHDTILVGSFHATARGILTVNSAGNSGTFPRGISSIAPWLLSVGASTTDRLIVEKLILGDGRIFTGRVLNPLRLTPTPIFSLAYGNMKNSSCDEGQIKRCERNCLDRHYVKGKIVLCDMLPRNITELVQNEAAGVIVEDYPNHHFNYPLPTIALEPAALDQVRAYANTTTPRATITIEGVKDPLAPVVADFSSRGPNTYFPDVMKPDVVAPGVAILAAWPPNIPPSKFDKPGSVKYNLDSGTSMACPHAAGAIAYIKSLHPDWSPAALKSALMTTARPLNASLHPERDFDYGSGNIDPVKASDPGLVYDISEHDYINHLCGTYGSETCSKISGASSQCGENKTSLSELNYPAMTAKINESTISNVSFVRTVTNVGHHPISTYKAAVFLGSEKLKITVAPDALSFNSLNERRSFRVSITGEYPQNEKIVSSSLVWSDGTHTVRSPIILYT
uniref:Uncharacterized protein n=1 Tax=Kalanchoe fedtschenkoi TaxID=63787 RepID=A0A7N0UJX1_KALFE